jgi:hypothetical protein
LLAETLLRKVLKENPKIGKQKLQYFQDIMIDQKSWQR